MVVKRRSAEILHNGTSGRLTLEYTARALIKRGLLNDRQYREILLKKDVQTARLKKVRESEGAKLEEIEISPVDLIVSFRLEAGDSKILSEDMITETLADEIGIPYKKIDPLKLNLEVITKNVSRPYALKHLIVPVEENDGVITVAVVDPFDMTAIDSLSRARKIKIKTVMSSRSDVLNVVREFYGFHTSVSAAEAEMSSSLELGNLEQLVKLKDSAEIEATDYHIINAVEYILHYAFDQRASDIHIEPKRELTEIRLRIDGILHQIHKVTRKIHPPITSRIKMLAGMDISEKRRPQDGRIKTNYKGKEIELRVSTLPVAFGEKTVIRIFDPDVLLQDISNIGLTGRDYELYLEFINRPTGVILVTGPTGSGKTTTLYSTLKALSSPEVNIVTIEDPIEMVMEEFNQVGVRTKIDVTFASVLRTILRQDPDIIMVGEVRDTETAENVIQAALTGHLVLTTLHTNDAPSSVQRLLDLGAPSFLLSSTIVGIIAQRLVRKICPNCKTERELTEKEVVALQLDLKQYNVSYGKGCKECRSTGYIGRIGIFEVMEFTEGIISALNDKAELKTLQAICKSDGMLTLRQNAIKKMLEGITTFEEVVAVTRGG